MSEIELHRYVATGTLASGSVMSKTVKLLSSLRGRHQHPDIDVLLSQSMVCCCHFTPVFSQVRVAFAAVVTSLHCERSCARENVSVRDKPVSEEM